MNSIDALLKLLATLTLILVSAATIGLPVLLAAWLPGFVTKSRLLRAPRSSQG